MILDAHIFRSSGKVAKHWRQLQTHNYATEEAKSLELNIVIFFFCRVPKQHSSTPSHILLRC